MTSTPHYKTDWWLVHETKTDCNLLIRSNRGFAFYCKPDSADFVDPPQFERVYLKCLELLRGGEYEEGELCDEDDAVEWLVKPFRPLFERLAPSPPLPLSNPHPSLSQYLAPAHFVCSLEVKNEEPVAHKVDTNDSGFRDPMDKMDKEFMADLDSWTTRYSPSDVKLCYDNVKLSLIAPPSRVLIEGKDGKLVNCFFKPISEKGREHTKKELLAYKNLTLANIPPTARICRLNGVVCSEVGIFGFLLTFIDKKAPLGRGLAKRSSPELRKSWQAQITESVGYLHQHGLVWGDAKPANILIDKAGNAWIIDFGGGYTRGWVDKEKAGTVEGDLQGLAKIMETLS